MTRIRWKIFQSSAGDYWGIWANRLINKRRLLDEKVTTLSSYLKCIYWNISIGNGCRFFGNMHFSRFPSSTIEIGDACLFRSATWSNKVGINRPCMISTLRSGAKLRIGNRSGFSGTVISAAESIKIGSDVLCGANVTITDTDWHHMDRSKEGIEDPPSSPVIIADGVWLGMGVTVLKGVTIHSGAVVGANSIVMSDIPSRVFAAGQPAKVIRQLS